MALDYGIFLIMGDAGFISSTLGAQKPWTPELTQKSNIGAFITTNAVLGVPYYDSSIRYPQNPILMIKAPYIKTPTIDPLWTPFKEPFTGSPILIIKAPYSTAYHAGRGKPGRPHQVQGTRGIGNCTFQPG